MAKIHIPTAGIDTTSVVAWSSEPSKEELDALARSAERLDNYDEPMVRPCPTLIPEPHGLGEFPMSCYRCHMEADS